MMGPQRMFGMTPWVRRLIVANLLVFLLQVTIFAGPRFIAAFGLDPLRALAQPWTFASYMFLHGGVLHLAFNLLALFIFGPPVEERIGGRAFLTYYLLCGLGGALLSYGLALVTTVGTTIGASAAVFGVALAFAWYWPNERIYVFPLPVPVPVKWLVVFLVAVSLLFALFPGADGVAHLAHLGGFGTGFVYLKVQDWHVSRAERSLRQTAPQPTALLQAATQAARGRSGAGPRQQPGRPEGRATSQAEVDRVLDKISATGMTSLTPAERKFLVEMSRRMRDRE
jgi:membrane associated rhomboid family serine protease